MKVTEMKVENPYVGPRPFEEQHQRRFFGRDWEADELVSLVVAHPAVLLYAQSGAGKTSLLNAKLIPLLRDEEGLQVMPVARVRGEVPEGLQPEQIKNLFVFNTLLGWLESGADPAQLVDLSLSAFLEERPRPKDEEGQPTLRVAIFDQFEELFTLYPERWTEREGFFAQVADALSEDPFLRVLFVLREDYLAQLDPYVALLPERLRTRFRLERLRQEAALAAVKGPLMDTERSFAPGVAESLVEELLKIWVETRVGETVEVLGEFVEPVQLQVVCRSLWEELPPEVTEITLVGATPLELQAFEEEVPPEVKEITLEHLRTFGDVDQALLTFYERALSSTVQQAKVRERKLRDWFERDLVTPMGTRGTVYRGMTSTGGVPNTAVDALEGQHLIRAERRAGARWYELTHDRFIGPIQRSNETWRAARRERWLRIGGGLAVALVLLFVGITALQTVISSYLRKEMMQAQATGTVAAQGAGTAVAQVEATARAASDPEVQATADFRVWQTAQAQDMAASHNLETVQAQATFTRLAAATPEPGVTETPLLDPTAIAAVETATAAAESLQIAQQKVTVAAAELRATATAAAATSATAAARESREQLQTAGLPPMEDVTSRLSRHPVKRFDRRTLDQIKYLIIQHSALPGDISPEIIANFLVEKKEWPGIGYHFYITSDGTIYLTNDLKTVSCFAGADAQYSPLGVCICFAGDFTDEVPTAAQLSSGGKLLAFLMQELHLSVESIKGQKEFVVTQSPGNQWDSGQKWKDMLLAQVKAAQGAGLADIEEALALVKDRDGDGIPDAEDACPDEPGSSLTGGCPEPTPTITPSATPTAIRTPTPTPMAALTGKIAFTLWNGAKYDVWVANVDGSDRAMIIRDMRQPAFSPSGSKIAVNGEVPDHMNLHVANADGSNLIEVTTNFEDGRPSWSPDGYHIVFDSNRHGDRRWRIYILDDVFKRTEGHVLRSAGDDTFGQDPCWLRDGHIVYKGCDYWAGGANCGLYTVPSDGSAVPTQLTKDSSDMAPAAHDDKIAFMSIRDGNWEIYSINTAGSDLKRLTNNGVNDGLPTFSPNGRFIAFVSDEGGKWAIWAMNADGSGRRKLFDLDGGYGSGEEYDWTTERISWAPTDTSEPVTGRYAQVWERLGGAKGPLGRALAPAVEGFYAKQHFKGGLMHWGRQDEAGNYEVHVIVYGEGGDTKAGDLWERFEDYWKAGDEEYPCSQATPPLGPLRGFGLVWCKYVRDSVGAPLEEEWGDDQGGYQDFQGGTMLWIPKDGGIYVLLNRGDWRFEPVE